MSALPPNKMYQIFEVDDDYDVNLGSLSMQNQAQDQSALTKPTLESKLREIIKDPLRGAMLKKTVPEFAAMVELLLDELEAQRAKKNSQFYELEVLRRQVEQEKMVREQKQRALDEWTKHATIAPPKYTLGTEDVVKAPEEARTSPSLLAKLKSLL